MPDVRSSSRKGCREGALRSNDRQPTALPMRQAQRTHFPHCSGVVTVTTQTGILLSSFCEQGNYGQTHYVTCQRTNGKASN